MSHRDPCNPATIGFVVQCLALGVISNAELRAWAEERLAADDDCPIYLEGLAEFDGPAGEVTRMLGFVPGRRFSPEEVAALTALGHLRPSPLATAGAPRGAAAAALERHPELLAEFRRTFPLLDLEPPPGPPLG